jgi:voltage-gated potassium channel
MHTEPLLPRRLMIGVALVAAVVVLGLAGYHWIEGYGWFDALYMTVLLISTIGGGELVPLSRSGRILSLMVIVTGIGVLSYTLLSVVQYVVEGQLRRAVGSRAMRRKVSKLQDHLILCGFGRVGTEIARNFHASHEPFVLIDFDQDRLQSAAELGYGVVAGDAADIEVLRRAGIDQARALVTALDNDANNIYVTISARVLRPELYIVARASGPDAEDRLRLAGANHIVSPYVAGARLMSTMAMHPTSADAVEQLEQELGA